MLSGGRPRRGPARLLGRALRLRCPHCGRAPMFRTFFAPHRHCGACGLSFERDEREDYWLGAFLLNLIVTETLFAVLVAAILVATWPRPAWSLLVWAGAIQTIVTAVGFYPFSKALWLAADLTFRPAEASDFTAPDDAAGVSGR